MPGGAKIKIAALTASVFKDQDTQIRLAGCDAVVHKPYQPQRMFETMARLLGVRYRYAAPDASVPSALVQQTSADLATLSPGTARHLRQAAQELSKKKVLALAAELENAHAALADYLRQETAAYRFESIVALFDRSGKEAGE